MYYHKVHKGFSQRTQKFCAPCALLCVLCGKKTRIMINKLTTKYTKVYTKSTKIIVSFVVK